MEWITDPNAWVALVTLTALEIVLGIDNVIFIAILASKLPASQQAKGRGIGLAGAMVTRILFLLSITWIMRLTRPLFTLAGHAFSGRDLILLAGGLFLLAKSTVEIHDNLEGDEHHPPERAGKIRVSLPGVVAQIMLLDVVFSIDSVITAIGLAKDIGVMVTAIVLAVIVMIALAGRISDFVEKHPTLKMLALSFLLLIGFSLVGEGLGLHIPKGYIYFAMAFSVFVEMLNMRMRRRAAPLHLRNPKAAALQGVAEDDPPPAGAGA